MKLLEQGTYLQQLGTSLLVLLLSTLKWYGCSRFSPCLPLYPLTREKQLDYSMLFPLQSRQGSEMHMSLKQKNQGAGSAVYVVVLLQAAASLKRQIHEVDHDTGCFLPSFILLFPMISTTAEEGSEFKQDVILRDSLQVGPFGKRTQKIQSSNSIIYNAQE